MRSIAAVVALTSLNAVAAPAKVPSDPAQRVQFCYAKGSHAGDIIDAMKHNEPYRFSNEPQSFRDWTSEALKDWAHGVRDPVNEAALVAVDCMSTT